MLAEDIWFESTEKYCDLKNFFLEFLIVSQSKSTVLSECSQNEIFSSDVTREYNKIVNTTGLAWGALI